MKKLFSVVLCFVAVSLLLLCSCNGQAKTFWKEEDFSFYDENGKERIFPTVDDYWIHLEDTDGLRTYRGVKIGDRATSIADLYDLTDFKYEIGDFSRLNPSTDKAKEMEKKLKEEGTSVKDILEMLPNISKNGLGVYLYCDIYEKDGKLCTESELGEITDKEVIDYFGYGEVEITDRQVEMYKYRLLKYSISFTIEHETITDVSIESTYHNRLQ